MKDKNNHMQAALQEALEAERRGEVPIGAVITLNDTIISRGSNRVIELRDPTAHAEIMAIREAAKKLGNERLIDCTLFITLEPCAMCAGAISLARIKKVVMGAVDPKGGAILHGPQFFDQPTCHHRPLIEFDALGDACGTILKDFFRARRKK